MKEEKLLITIKSCVLDELSEADRTLIAAARRATERSYAPYSHFRVGAAARLANGAIVEGSNQENAAYPSGLCAERVTMFQACSRFPDQPITSLAIAACNDKGIFTPIPVTPCGACRQVLAEIQSRHKQPTRLLMFGTEEIYVAEDARELLPLAFENI